MDEELDDGMDMSASYDSDCDAALDVDSFMDSVPEVTETDDFSNFECGTNTLNVDAIMDSTAPDATKVFREDIPAESEFSEASDANYVTDRVPEEAERTDAPVADDAMAEGAEDTEFLDASINADTAPEVTVEMVTAEMLVDEETIQEISNNMEPLEEVIVDTGFEDITIETEDTQDLSVDAESSEDIHADMAEDIPTDVPQYGPGPAQTALGEYLSEHNYGPDDYAQYSQDPQWQQLNNEFLVEIGREPIDYTGQFSFPERAYDEFEETIRLDQENFYDSGTFYTQGINEYGYTGTCGETSMASTINRVLGTNEYTENKVLDVAVQEGLCDTSSFQDSGGTTTDQFMALYEKMNEVCSGQLEVECHDFDNVLSIEEVAQRLEEGCTINVAVDSNTLWEQADPMGSPFPEVKATDHWITVTDVHRDHNGAIEGFDIIDSGGGESYVDAEKYEAMCYGTDSLELTDPTCIVVSKKDDVISATGVDVPTVETVTPTGQLDAPSGVFGHDDTYEQFSTCPEDSDEAFELQRLIHQSGRRC